MEQLVGNLVKRNGEELECSSKGLYGGGALRTDLYQI